jgi:hypothetical protein
MARADPGVARGSDAAVAWNEKLEAGTRSCARGPSTSVYFRDPDDNLVELTVYPT